MLLVVMPTSSHLSSPASLRRSISLALCGSSLRWIAQYCHCGMGRIPLELPPNPFQDRCNQQASSAKYRKKVAPRSDRRGQEDRALTASAAGHAIVAPRLRVTSHGRCRWPRCDVSSIPKLGEIASPPDTQRLIRAPRAYAGAAPIARLERSLATALATGQ